MNATLPRILNDDRFAYPMLAVGLVCLFVGVPMTASAKLGEIADHINAKARAIHHEEDARRVASIVADIATVRSGAPAANTISIPGIAPDYRILRYENVGEAACRSLTDRSTSLGVVYVSLNGSPVAYATAPRCLPDAVEELGVVDIFRSRLPERKASNLIELGIRANDG